MLKAKTRTKRSSCCTFTTNYWGFQTTSAAAGSGFILTEDGYILTNYHVVENSNSITVAMYANGDTYDATLIGYDESNDVAVLKVDAEGCPRWFWATPTT